MTAHPSEGRAAIVASLPGWHVVFVGFSRIYRAESPAYHRDGLVIEGPTPDEVVRRAQVLLASGWRPGLRQVDPRPSGPRTAESGFSGEACHDCGSLRTVRTGTCLTCQECGSSSECG